MSAGLFIVAGLAEEALCRGYPLQTFVRARLFWLGTLITSVAFAAGHLKNPNAGAWLAFVNTALAGVWLAVAYLRTRSLWFPLGRALGLELGPRRFVWFASKWDHNSGA